MKHSTQVRALVVRGPGQHGLEPISRPVPSAGEALVGVTFAAVCSSDLRLLRGGLHDTQYPVIPGHEWVGVVLEAPDRPELVGSTVVGEGITPCGKCIRCRESRFNLCLALDEVGFTRPGAFAEAFTLPAHNLRVLPETISSFEACLVEPLCVALHALERAGDVSNRSVGVIGAGAIGLLVAQLAQDAGARRVSIAERAPQRRQLAAELRLETATELSEWHGDPPEIVFDATGVAAVFPLGVAITRPGGTYVLVGYSGDDAVAFSPSALMLREISVRGVLSGYAQVDTALALLAAGRIALRPLLGDPIPFTEKHYRALLDAPGETPVRSAFTFAGS
jgi:2-desacetyl-2-hydroxyethyl bacteriochlorophyllide A dehydrogenase